MATYQYEYYLCPKCKVKSQAKKCKDCNVATKGQGKVSMRFRLAEDCKVKQKRTGWYTTKKEAEAEYLKIKSEAPVVEYISDNKQSYIFEDLLKQHLFENALSTAPSTQYAKEKDFAKHITPYFKGKDVRKITKNQLISWQTYTFSKDVGDKHNKRTTSYKQASKIRGFLFTFFDWIFYKYEIPNLLRMIKLPANNQPKKTKEFLELSEFTALDEASKDDILWNTIFSFMMHSGNRVGEIQALSESDYQNGEITISKTVSKGRDGNPHIRNIPKNKKPYVKPLDNFIQNKLDKYLSWKRKKNISSKFLFGGDDFIDIHQFDRALEYYLEKAGITKHITNHSFRYSYVSMLIDMDCSTKTVAEMIGDTEKVTMETYSHLYTSKKRRTVDRLNDYITNFSGT